MASRGRPIRELALLKLSPERMTMTRTIQVGPERLVVGG